MLTSELLLKMSDRWDVVKSDKKNFILLISKRTNYKFYLPNTPMQPIEFVRHILEYVVHK